MTEILALAVGQGIKRIDPDRGTVRTLTADAGDVPDGVVEAGGTVYWTTMGRPRPDTSITTASELGLSYAERNGGLHAIGLDGSGRRDLLPPGAITTGKQLTTDGRRLYWGDREGCRVSSATREGTDLQDLVVREPGDDGLSECVGVAVDVASGHLYWTQKGPSDGGRGRIFRAGLHLPPGERADARTDIETLWADLPEPIDLEIVDGWLLWTDRGAPPQGNTLNAAPLPRRGERGAPPRILARGYGEAIGLAVDPRARTAYVADLAGTVHAVDLDRPTAGPGRLVASLGGKVTGLALVGGS